MPVFNQLAECIAQNKNFVLQGGAGSGKTETLKMMLEFISQEYPQKNIACITHTNLAVDEIKSRVSGHYTISTIHSFLNSFIQDYKKNIHGLMYEIFKIEALDAVAEYENYKSLYKKYAAMLFTVKRERSFKVIGKREYDKDSQAFNTSLNEKTTTLNEEILAEILRKDPNKIDYNETRFNDFHDLTYGHDGLIDLSYLLFQKYKTLGKILQDKFDCIFIDEYQDTNEKIIEIFLKFLPQAPKTLIGLFGDSMQAIYDDGIGDVENYVRDGILLKINKEDNYRCSAQVVKFINQLRGDGLVQNVAFKVKANGVTEVLNERQGSVTLYYSIYGQKPHAGSPQAEKDEYIQCLNGLILTATETQDNYRQLKLTNKSIAADIGFNNLYNIFSERFIEPQEYIEKHFSRLQFSDLFDLYNAYIDRNYNFVFSILKKQGFLLKKSSDKLVLKNNLDRIINSNKSAIETLNEAFDLGLVRKSEKYKTYLAEKDSFLKELRKDRGYQDFKRNYLGETNTFTKMKAASLDIEEEDFYELERAVIEENFYERLFSTELKFSEIQKYYQYIDDKTKYTTMHKTKGSGIENVLVVLEEYFWSSYNFRTAFSESDNDLDKKIKNQKLVYVACSRAKTNLICVKLLSDDAEEAAILKYFENVIKI